jgi:hypothetical protein
MSDATGAPAPKHTTQLGDTLDRLPLARGLDGKGYVRLGHHWMRIDSDAVRSHVTAAAARHGSYGRGVVDQHLARMVAATHQMAPEDISMRVAYRPGLIFIDLCNDKGQVARVDAQGWKVLDASPVKFTRSSTMAPLPIPVAGGCIEELLGHINMPPEDLPLVVGWLMGALMPKAPRPVLCLSGGAGSAKSTATRTLRDIIDPRSTGLGGAVSNERDLVAALAQSHVLACDNLSAISNRMSDAFCRVATGGSLGARALYTNDEQHAVETVRPILINGIPDLVHRGDLGSRAISIRLKPIAKGSYRPESEMKANFAAAHPRLLGCILDGLASGLARFGEVDRSNLPRMADFAAFATAAEPAFGWVPGTIAGAFARNQEEANRERAEEDELGSRLIAIAAKGPREIPKAELLAELRAGNDNARLPRTTRELTEAISRIGPDLEAAGVHIKDGRKATVRTYVITRK